MIAQSWPRSKRMSHRSNRCLGAGAGTFRRSSAARVAEQNCAEVKRKHSATLEEPRENAELYGKAGVEIAPALFFHFELELPFRSRRRGRSRICIYEAVLVRVVRDRGVLPGEPARIPDFPSTTALETRAGGPAATGLAPKRARRGDFKASHFWPRSTGMSCAPAPLVPHRKTPRPDLLEFFLWHRGMHGYDPVLPPLRTKTAVTG